MFIPNEKITWSELNSGLKVITVEMPNFYTISAGLFVGVGSRHEAPSEMGIAHFIEHLLFKGSKKYNAKEISEIIEGKGGVLNAYTAEDSSCFYLKTLPKSFFESLDVLVDFYTEPLFDPIELEKEKEVVIEELHSFEDQPSSYIEDLFSSVIWQDHPLGNLILGTEENILKYSVEDVRKFFNKYYTSTNTVLAVAGCITHEAVLEWVKKEEGRFRRGPKNTCLPFIVQQTKPRVHVYQKETEQCNVQVGVPCADRYSQEQWALRILSCVAGENMSSRLFQEIREKRGLAYHISSTVEFYNDVGSFSWQSGVDIEKVDVCLKESLQVLGELSTTVLSTEELERAKAYTIGQALQDMESTLSYMLWVGDKLLSEEREFATACFCQKVQAVTAEEVLQVAKNIFCTPHLNLALIGPCKEKSAYEKYLKF